MYVSRPHLRALAAPSAAVTARVFVVGCARSGTTLLQAMLARHPRVFTLPETHFFWKAERSRLRRRLGLVTPVGRVALVQMLRELGREDLLPLLPGRSPLLRSHAAAFSRVLDRVASEAGRDVWVEKTPLHIRRIETITRHVARARFVHILRDGRDVIASLHDAATRSPDIWGEPSLDRLIQRWNTDVEITLAYRRSPGHHVVAYDRLLPDTAGELAGLCSVLGIEFDPAMLRHWDGVEDVMGRLATRPWMQNAFKPVRKGAPLEKFRRRFSTAEQRYIEQHLLYGGQVTDRLAADPLGPPGAVPCPQDGECRRAS